MLFTKQQKHQRKQPPLKCSVTNFRFSKGTHLRSHFSCWGASCCLGHNKLGLLTCNTICHLSTIKQILWNGIDKLKVESLLFEYIKTYEWIKLLFDIIILVRFFSIHLFICILNLKYPIPEATWIYIYNQRMSETYFKCNWFPSPPFFYFYSKIVAAFSFSTTWTFSFLDSPLVFILPNIPLEILHV